MKQIPHCEFKKGDEVERIDKIIKQNPKTKYDRNFGVVISVYSAPVTGALVSIKHGASNSKRVYQAQDWQKISPNK